MAAADLDVGYVSAHLGLPEQTISTVVSEPTAELVRTLLDAVIAKAREFDTLEAEKLQLGIELEGAVRSSEARCEQFKETADKALKEVEDIRQKLRDEGGL
jgi:nucleoprotein TPR